MADQVIMVNQVIVKLCKPCEGDIFQSLIPFALRPFSSGLEQRRGPEGGGAM